MSPADSTYPRLFEALAVRGLELRNRIVYPPMATRYDTTTLRARAYYAERARGGAGLIVVESTPIDRFAEAGYADSLRGLVETIHAAGAKAALQLSAPPRGLDGAAIAPSATPDGAAREATVEEIGWVQGRFARAAAGVREAGFDAVEVHGAHGYFTSQFYSPRANFRRDAYGGSRAARMRFALETVRAIRQSVGPDYPILFRLSAVEPVPDGVTLEDSAALGPALADAGVDVLDVSSGIGGLRPSQTSPLASEPLATFAQSAAAIRRQVDVPVIAIGRMNQPNVAEGVLAGGQADLIAIGRQLFVDPFWPVKAADGREGEIVACRSCNRGCLGNLERGEPISCRHNPRAGREYLD